MRVVITLLIPATKVGAIERVLRHLAASSRLRGAGYGAQADIVAFELADDLRNPLAFVHEALNFITPQMMGKPTFPEGPESFRGRDDE